MRVLGLLLGGSCDVASIILFIEQFALSLRSNFDSSNSVVVVACRPNT